MVSHSQFSIPLLTIINSHRPQIILITSHWKFVVVFFRLHAILQTTTMKNNPLTDRGKRSDDWLQLNMLQLDDAPGCISITFTDVKCIFNRNKPLLFYFDITECTSLTALIEFHCPTTQVWHPLVSITVFKDTTFISNLFFHFQFNLFFLFKSFYWKKTIV